MKRNLSDDNTLKNQQNQIKKYDKYKKALKPKPSPQYKYYDYLTNQQRELDYINYLSNTQISNDKKNVEKQLENAVMLKDKFTANLEAQKKQIELEKQQRQARQKEVFAQDLFDAKKNEQTFREKEAKETLAKRIKAAPIRKEFSNMIGEARFEEFKRKSEERKAKAAEALKTIKPPESGMTRLAIARIEEAKKKDEERLNREFIRKENADRIAADKKAAEDEKVRRKFYDDLNKKKKIPIGRG
jgi:hypothetical protein